MKRLISFPQVVAAMVMLSAVIVAFGSVVMPAPTARAQGLTIFTTGFATTLPAVPAVLTPLAGEMAQAAAMPVETVLMIQVIGFPLLLFPYQAPPVVLAIQMGGLKPKTVVHF